MGEEISDKDLAITLIGSLPHEVFQSLIVSLDVMMEEKMCFGMVRSLLVCGVDRKAESSNVIDARTAMIKLSGRCNICKKVGHMAKNCFQKKGQKSSTPRGVECHNSGKIGHIAKSCWKNNDAKGGRSKAAVASEKEEEIALKCSTKHSKVYWIFDSGASQHMTPNLDLIDNYKKYEVPRAVKLGDDAVIPAYGCGSMSVKLENGEIPNVRLHDVLYVPDLGNSLLSVPSMTKRGAQILFSGDQCTIMKGSKVVGKSATSGNVLSIEVAKSETAQFALSEKSMKLRHGRFGHVNVQSLKKAASSEAFLGMGDVAYEKFNCESCADGKQHKTSFPKSVNQSSELLQVVRSDVCGTMETDSLGGSRYFVTFFDVKSKYVHVYFMSHKSEVTEVFKKFCNMAENRTERRIKILRSDNGGEYRSKEMEKFQSERGIVWQTTIPYTPEQNGVAERMNRTKLETENSMLSFAKLDKPFWAEAVSTAVYIRNKSLPSNDSVTPYEKWFGTKPDVSNLCIFGRFETRSMVVSRDVNFLESQLLKDSFLVTELSGGEEFSSQQKQITIEVVRDEEGATTIPDDTTVVQVEPVVETVTEEPQVLRTYERTFMNSIENLPDKRKRKPAAVCCVANDVVEEPKTLKSALNSAHSEEWLKAAESEFQSLTKMKTWQLVPRENECCWKHMGFQSEEKFR